VRIPFLDLSERTRVYRAALDDAYRSVMESGQFIQGPHLDSFESNFAAYCESKVCVGVGNGLDALSLILQAYEIGPGDEVIVPSNTYIATWLAISAVGATPVPVEPNPRTWNLDVAAMTAAMTQRSRAVIAVHLYGQSAEMRELRAFSTQHGIKLIEDAAQAVGGRLEGKPAGSWGDAAAFSFFPTKNLGAFGDGGAVVSNDPEFAERVRRLGSYGGLERNEHEIIGRNSRLDELQAAFLDVCLPFLERDNRQRRHLASLYEKRLASSTAIAMQEVPPSVEPTWHLFPVRVTRRDRVREELEKEGIGTAIHYPLPPNLSTAYRDHAIAPQPIAEAMAGELLSLPLHPHLSDAEVETVCEALLKAVG
jgi:dTDP-4-amino-4,6-dideoxygalactose transaminase